LNIKLSDDPEIASKQESELKDWPIDGIEPFTPPTFTAASGPTPPRRFRHNYYDSPKALFELFFNETVRGLIINHTNINGRRKHGNDWIDCDHKSLRAMIGTMIRMGKSPAERLRQYWHTTRGWDPVRTVWAQGPFEMLYYSLHIETAERPSDSPTDRLWDVQTLSEQLNANYAAALRPGSELIVDETMIAYRGKHPSFQMMRRKPKRRGFKEWTIADPSGYVYRQSLYVGHTGIKEIDKGLMYRTVMDLMEPYLDENRTVITDSAFTSQKLLKDLWARNTMGLGKVKGNTVFPFHARKSKLEPNQFVCIQNSDCKALSATVYFDGNRRSEYLSTASALAMTVVQIQPAASDHSYPAPSVTSHYNRTCVGVDIANRYADFHSLHRKHYRSYMTFLEYFINVAMSNAWTIYRRYRREHSTKPIKDFDEWGWLLSDELIGDFCACERQGRPPHPITAVHKHFLPTHETEDRLPQQRCSVCFSRVGGVAVGNQTAWRCACGAAVCHTNAECWPTHLATMRATAEP